MDTTTSPRVSCIANYAYDASEPDELTIRPGDVLHEVDQLPGGWWRGELKGRRGMFPDNFVSVLSEKNSIRTVGVQGRCRAVFSYQPANSDELPLCVGDVLEVLGEVEEGWWQGRRQGRVGVFPSNFVVMLEPSAEHSLASPPYEPAPALPPKPVKEQCRVLFPYTAVNEDELSLSEGDIVTLVTKDTSDRGWWRGELHGRVGLFPDNFVQLLPADVTNNKIASAQEEDSKPERPPAKTTNAIYPVLNKYSEKTASVKELTTSKISMHKESTISKESSTQSTVTHSSKSESEKLVHSKTTTDGALDGLKFSGEDIYASKFSMPKKPSVPLKKSPTPTSAVGGLFSGLKSKMMPTSDKDKTEKSSNLSSGSSNGGDWDRLDGSGSSKPTAPDPPTSIAPTATNTSTFDHVERNSILNDPRVGRAKAPRRRPPSQALRDDTPQQIGLSNGHEVPVDKPTTDKSDEIKPRTREWEKHKAPWMEELKLNQAKKTVMNDTKPRTSSEAPARTTGSTDRSFLSRRYRSGSFYRILDCGLEEKRSTHSMEMSKSTSSISNRISVLENLEASLETKTRHSSEARKDPSPAARPPPPPLSPLPPLSPSSTPIAPCVASVPTVPSVPTTLHSPTAAGRTLTAMLDDIKRPTAPPPAVRSDFAPGRPERLSTSMETPVNKPDASLNKQETTANKLETPISKLSATTIQTIETTIETSDRKERFEEKSTSLKEEGSDALIAQLNDRILNLEKLLEVQNAKFNAAIAHLNSQLILESEKRQALQAEIEKLAHCVTQV